MENENNTELMMGKCRSCLDRSGAISLFEKADNFLLPFSEMFFACTSINVLPGVCGLHKLCLICTNRLKDAFLFREQCQESEDKLKDIYVLKQEIKPETLVNFVSCDYDASTPDCRQSDNEEPEEPCLQNTHNTENTLLQVDDFKIEELPTLQDETRGSNVHNKSTGKTIQDLYLTNGEIMIKKPKKKKKNSKIDDESSQADLLCDVCTYSTKKKSNFIEHLRSHQGEKPFECKTCNKSYSDKLSLRIHSKKCRAASVCEVCGKVYRDLQLHRLRHSNKKPHACSMCANSYCSSLQLKRHLNIHNKEGRVRTHTCTTCSKSFFNGRSLSDHRKTHDTQRDLYTCSICHKTYVGKSGLNAHMTRHTIHKKFKCDHCLKAFHSKADLASHMKTHIGKRVFSCDECDKSFVRKTSLATHKISHSKTKNYVCEICNQRFAHGGSLCDHRRKKHNIQSNRIIDPVYSIST